MFLKGLLFKIESGNIGPGYSVKTQFKSELQVDGDIGWTVKDKNQNWLNDTTSGAWTLGINLDIENEEIYDFLVSNSIVECKNHQGSYVITSFTQGIGFDHKLFDKKTGRPLNKRSFDDSVIA